MAAIFAVLMGSMMFGQTAPGIAALGVARGAAVEVFEVLDRVPPIDSSSEKGLKPANVEGQVVFDSVGFSYVSVISWACLFVGGVGLAVVWGGDHRRFLG